MSWKVTVRHGSQVKREKFETLAEAVDEARAQVDAVRREGGLPEISAFRDYAPDQRVHARIEISGPGLIRSPEGGLDVTGDFRPGVHEWGLWDAQIQDVLRWLVPGGAAT